MKRIEVLKIAKETYRLIDSQMFALAFEKIRLLLKDLSKWWAISKTEELEMLCKQMLKYSLGDVIDPEKEKIRYKLQHDMYYLVDDIVDEIGIKDFSSYDYEQKRINDISELKVNDIILSLEKLNDSAFDEETSNYTDLLFNYVWLHEKLKNDDVLVIENCICNENLNIIIRQMIVSALMLKGLRSFDAEVINIFIKNINCKSIEVRSRIIVSLVFLMSVYDERISRDFYLSEKLTRLFDEEKFIKEIDSVYKYAIKTFGTDKITQKINNEIYPELMRSSSKIQKIIKDNREEILSEDEFNPKWEKALDDIGLSDKIRQFNDMQMKGDDVYMSTFSSMKTFSFFSNLSHWFMPFNIKQKDVSTKSTELKELLSFFENSNQLCNSDKYSFFYSLCHMPLNNIQAIMSGLGEDMNLMKDEIKVEKWKNSEGDKFNSLVRIYILDLFRFYRLFPRRIDFVNPFEVIGKLNKNGFLYNNISLSIKESICKYLFNVGKFSDAVLLFEYLDLQQVWDAYFYQQMGYCYQKMNLWTNALECYEKSELIEPNDIWTLKHIAHCYKKINNISKAIDSYELVLKNTENDLSVMLNLAWCYISKKEYDKARSFFYKADYLKPDNLKTIRGLAWCLFLCKDYDKSMEYYKLIIKDKECLFEDAINAGHTAWALGDKENAKRYYKIGKDLINDSTKFADIMFKDSEYMKNIGLSDGDIMILINQILFM